MVGIKPKPQFMGLFQFMDTHSGSPTTSENKSPEPDDGSELALTGWWRRGRVELYRERGLAVLVMLCHPSFLHDQSVLLSTATASL